MASPGSPEGGGSGDCGGGGGGGRERLLFPDVKIRRIMRRATPENGKISKYAAGFMQDCVFQFISFVTCEAAHRCQAERRKAITGNDLLLALAALGFEDYVGPLKLYLQLYRQNEGDGKGSPSVEWFGREDALESGDSVDLTI